MGFFGITVSNGIQFTGLQYSSVGNMTLISTTAPVITVILARIFLNERLNLIQIIGIIISFFGTLYLNCTPKVGHKTTFGVQFTS